jgi:hypothetical protein
VVIPPLPKPDGPPASTTPPTTTPTTKAEAAGPEDTVAVRTRRVPTISPAPGPVPAPPVGPLPIVRKQGYDSAAVDQRLQMLAADRDELTKATRMIVVLSIVLGIVIGIMDWVLQLIFVDGVARLAR